MYNRMMVLLGLFPILGVVVYADDSDTCCCCPENEPKVKLLIGPGLTYLQDDYVDFKEVREDDQYLFIDNDSRYRSELMAGVVHRLKCWKDFEFGAVFALEFSQGGQHVLDSGFFGGSIAHKNVPYIVFVAGYSRGLGTELSPGFGAAMGAYIKKERTKAAKENKEYLPHINVVDGKIEDVKHYDGLSLYDRSTSKRIYPGDPIINSFNSKFSVGVLFRFDARKIFSLDN